MVTMRPYSPSSNVIFPYIESTEWVPIPERKIALRPWRLGSWWRTYDSMTVSWSVSSPARVQMTKSEDPFLTTAKLTDEGAMYEEASVSYFVKLSTAKPLTAPTDGSAKTAQVNESRRAMVERLSWMVMTVSPKKTRLGRERAIV